MCNVHFMKHLVYIHSVLLILFIFTFQTASVANAEGTDEDESPPEDEILDDVSLDSIETYWDKVIHDYGGYIPELNKSSLYEMVKESKSLSIKSVFYGMLDYLFHELISSGKLLGMLLMLTLFSTILQTMHGAFERGSISKIAYFVVYILLLFLALNSFYAAALYAKYSFDTLHY